MPQPAPAAKPVVVLASGSRYRRELLGRLLPAFEVDPPAVDESALPGESPNALATRLARLKARHTAGRWPGCLVIGSDQVAACAGRILGKPGTAAAARAQLGHCAGHTLVLHTAVALIRPDGSLLEHLDHSSLRFRALEAEEIGRYVERDQPMDCAGGFRFESLGIALFSRVDTRDPTVIQGLPLLWLAAALRDSGLALI